MIKLEISSVMWTQNVDAGGGFNKALAASKAAGVRLWYLGHGVLVEHHGKPDVLVPISNVLSIKAPAALTPGMWAGEEAVPAPVAPVLEPAPVKMSEEPTPVEPKRGPGRPPKKGLLG